jgi:hypothetical protein
MIAKFVRQLFHPWHPGATLYNLDEPFWFNLDDDKVYTKKKLPKLGTNFIIVATTPKAIDHGRPESTAFVALKDGTLFGGIQYGEYHVPKLTPNNAEIIQCRTPNYSSHIQVLQKIDPKIEIVYANYPIK